MNSSSASNILNTSPVAPTVNSSPRRELSDNSSSNEFHQTLQNARADMRSEDNRNTKSEAVKFAKNTSLKKAQLRSDEQKQSVANDQAQSTKIADAKALDSRKVGASKKAADADADEKNAAEQSLTNQVLTDKPVENKATCENSLTNTDISLLGSDANGSTENPITDESNKLAVDAKTNSVDPSALAITSSVAVDKTATGEASADKVAASLLAETGTSINTLKDGDLNVSDKDASKAEKFQPVAADASLINTVAVDAASAALSGSTPGSITTPNSNSTADAQAALVAMAADSTKNASGTKPVVSDATAALAMDDQQSSTFAGDTKNGFEKMLQAMVAANTGQQSQDSSSQSSNPQTTNTAATPAGAIESLARAIDSQTPAARSFIVQTSVPVTVGQPSWSQAVGEKVLWLAAQNVSSAEIRLDPPDLGPMQVKVSVNQDQTNVSFTSHHPAVRELLDQNLHRLREMFNEQGLNLGSVDVSDKSFSRQQGEGKGQQGSGGTADGINEEETPVAVSTIVQQRLVDHYA